ncbi:MAG: sigma-70 family RNA polymerase sigma factor [Chloroflexi bacterium]|nr:sigma-70 family RNA polymerase sigma factor [Chloroflexota bacterium]
MDELEAIELLKRGDLNGLEPLAKKYYFQAVRSSYLIVQDFGLAEDIVQSAFLSSSQKIYQLSSDRFGPWFLRSVINASIKAANRQSRLLHLDAHEDEFTNQLKEWLLDRQPLPEMMVERQELRRQIKTALGQLTPNQRGAVVLKYYLEMSEAEMSHSLGAPVSSIKWWLHIARRKLRQLLAGYDDRSPSTNTQSTSLCGKEKEG